MIEKSTLPKILDTLTRKARDLGLTDTDWAARAGIRKETLSRLRRRQSCDFQTLQAFAHVVGMRVGVMEEDAGLTQAGLFPAVIDRDYEERLLRLCARSDFDVGDWRCLGPPFFMAGLAVMLASVPGFDRRGLLDLAEVLYSGSSQVHVFAVWLKESPLRPSRFLPMLAGLRRAA